MRPLLLLCLASISLEAQLTAEQKQLNTASFEKVWTTIRDKHWEKKPGGLDWQAIHDEFRPKIDRAESMDQARAVMREMIGRLHQTHFAIFPASVYRDVDVEQSGDGSSGMDIRVVDGRALVTSIDPGSPAEMAGVQRGWAIESVGGKELGPAIQKLSSDPEIHEIMLERAVLARLSGEVGTKIHVVFLDGTNAHRALDLALAEPRGNVSKFGNLPPMHVWLASKRVAGDIGYVGFNMFLDVVHVMSSYADAVNSCVSCEGLIIDLRGNPGGIAGMAMGMAGYLVDKPDQKLGTMYLRDTSIKFVINPQAKVFNGPVAILVDGSSASTSEIFAEGLKDLGRARIFGRRTAAAALPSIVEKLPNGDGFQYAIANYVSEGGQTLEANGVIPDVEVKLTRKALLAGKDPVVDAAVDWMKKQKGTK